MAKQQAADHVGRLILEVHDAAFGVGISGMSPRDLDLVATAHPHHIGGEFSHLGKHDIHF